MLLMNYIKGRNHRRSQMSNMYLIAILMEYMNVPYVSSACVMASSPDDNQYFFK